MSPYRGLFEWALIGYVHIDRNGRILGMNEPASSMFASTPQELLGVELSALVSSEDALMVHRHVQYVRMARTRHQCDARPILPAGEHSVLRIFSIALPRDDGSICAAILDVTDFRRLEEMAHEQERRPFGVVPRAVKSKTVLVVDDDGPTRTVLQRLLQGAGCRVLTAGGVSEALRVVEKESIDILLTDLVVSDGRGDTLADMLRMGIPELPVLFVSGWPMADDERTRRTLSQARTKFVSKSADFDAIAHALSELLERAVSSQR